VPPLRGQDKVDGVGVEVKAQKIEIDRLDREVEQGATSCLLLRHCGEIGNDLRRLARDLVREPQERLQRSVLRRETNELQRAVNRITGRRIYRCPRQELNLCTRFRKPLLYPLSYGGSATQPSSASGGGLVR
jgi:hypothetical protein